MPPSLQISNSSNNSKMLIRGMSLLLVTSPWSLPPKACLNTITAIQPIFTSSGNSLPRETDMFTAKPIGLTILFFLAIHIGLTQEINADHNWIFHSINQVGLLEGENAS